MANTATNTTARQMLDDDPMLAVDATGSEKKRKLFLIINIIFMSTDDDT